MTDLGEAVDGLPDEAHLSGEGSQALPQADILQNRCHNQVIPPETIGPRNAGAAVHSQRPNKFISKIRRGEWMKQCRSLLRLESQAK